jgi:hypothetical protein
MLRSFPIMKYILNWISHCLSAADGDVTCITVPSLQLFHEEAYTQIVFHLDYVQEANIIRIRSDDTVLLIIFMYYMPHADNQIRVWLVVGLASNNIRCFISVKELVDKIENNVLVALLGLHEFGFA